MEITKRFKRRYNKAVKNGDKYFDYKGQTFVTGYAKYLIEYAELQKNNIHIL